MTTLGIIGGGHIAKLLAQAAGVLAIDTLVFTPDVNAPAAKVTSQVITGSWQDESLLKQFAESCDVVTLESGAASIEMLRQIENYGIPVYPASKTMAQVQDKVLQLRTMQAAGIDTPRFSPVQTATDVMGAIEEFGFPLMLKVRHMGSSVSAVIRRSPEIPTALDKLHGYDLYTEACVPFVRELSITVARGRDGEMQFYPVVEVVRQNHMVYTVRCPAAIEEATAFKVTEIAKRAVEAVDGTGVFGVDLFELEGNDVRYHQIVPYPGDTGLYSIEGMTTSQFANHVRAVMGLPPGDVYQIAPATVTVAMLANQTGSPTLESLRDVLATGGTHVHLYGGRLSQGQTAGHVSVLGYATDGAEKVALLALSRMR